MFAADAEADSGKYPVPGHALSAHDAELAKLHAFVRQSRMFYRTHPRSGFASVIVDEPNVAATLHWHGAVPATVQAMMRRARAQGITVRVEPALYSLATIKAAQATVVRTLKSERVLFSRAGPSKDASELEVGLPASVTARSKIRSLVSGKVDVPVHMLTARLPVSEDNQRNGDVQNYSGGGGVIEMAGDNSLGFCTAGFPVHSSSGHHYVDCGALRRSQRRHS